MWLGNSVTTWASMAFKYSCFISYCHGQRDILSGFIDQFANALSSELELRMDQEVYVDKSRLKPGYIYDEALARAICESVCMIVVCSPRYLRHAYCRREYEAMRQLEERRRALLGEAAHGRGFIIPVILREDAALMAYIGDRAHYCGDISIAVLAAQASRVTDYRVAMSWTLAIFALCAYASFKAVRRGAFAIPSLALASATGAIGLVLLVAPYRLRYETFERVIVQGRRCSLIGASGSGLVIICPGLAPSTRVVSRNSVIERSDIEATLFDPVD